MIKKKLDSYRKIFTRDFAQRLYIFRRKSYKNDRCESNIYNNDIDIESCLSNLNNLTNKIIFKLMISASRVKIKIINFTIFSFLFCDKIAKIEFLIENRIYL